MPIDRPLPDDVREALKMLWSINEDQQANIDRHRDSLHKVWHVPPVKPREGMLVYADGSDWNPGSGPGYYVYYAGAWHAMSGGGGGGGGITVVQDEGIALPVRTILNFIGAGVVATDDAGNSRTNVTITGGGGGGAVTSVFTRIGDVIAATGDYTAAQVTNAVSILGSYANPGWITSLAYSKLTGVPTSFTPSAHTHAAADTISGIFAVARLGSGTPSSSNWLRGDGAWTALPAGAVTSVFTRTGAVVAVAGDYTAAQVTNAVSTILTYADPAWITSLAYSKLTGVPATFTPSAHVHAAADITSGVMAVARLGTGTPSSANFLRGDGAWTVVPAGGVTSVFTRTGAVVAVSGDYTAAQVTNAVSILGSYADPVWITSLAYAKITGAPAAGVPTSRQVIAGTGMSGGGALTADVTLNALPMIASGASGRGGTVPTPGTTAGTTRFLREDATWAAPPNTPQTPWAQNIAGAGFNLTNVSAIGIGTTNGSFPLLVREGADVNLVYSSLGGAATIQATNDAVNTYVPIRHEASAHILGGGNVGIGMAPTSYQLQLSTDSAGKTATSTWSVTSDARTKKNVQNLEGGLEVIEKLRPITAEFNGLGGTKDGERVVGFIAQEIAEILPYTVGAHPGKLGEEETQILDFNLHEVLIQLVLAVKQLKEKVELLEAAAATP